MEHHETLEIAEIHSLLVLCLVYFLTCHLMGEEVKNLKILQAIVPCLTKIFDMSNNENNEILIKRMLVLINWSTSQRLDGSAEEVVEEIYQVLALPKEIDFDQILKLRAHQCQRMKEKVDNLPLAKEVVMHLWDNYCLKKAFGGEIICQVVMTLTGNDYNQDDDTYTDR